MAYINITKENSETFVSREVRIHDGNSDKVGKITKVIYDQYLTEWKIVDENGEDHYAVGLYENANNEIGFHLI